MQNTPQLPDAAPPVSPDSSVDQRYRQILELALLGIYASRPDGALIWCNPAFASILGFGSVAEAIGTNMAVVYRVPQDRERFVNRIRERGRIKPWVAPMRRQDGREIQVFTTTVGVFDRDGALTELHGFIVDVTKVAEEEAALKEREQRFRSVFVDAADAMLILDGDRRVVDVNRAAASLFGVSEDALRTRTLDELVIDDADALAAGWRELLAIGEARREHRVVSIGGGSRVVECSYRAAVHPDRHLCIARDITDRRLVEERLVQSERIESVGRLAGGIAHDFNNLLTSILGYAELLSSNPAVDEAARADVDEIRKAGQRAAALTRQLLAYSRRQVLMPKVIDLNQAILNLKGMLARLIREDITLTCDLDSSPALVKIDPTQLEQVLLNLVLNSRDALPAGGFIRLEVARVSLADIDVPADQVAPAAEHVRLRVIDNGVGIPPEARAHLFEPFFTTKELGKGTGLGLASVHGIVRQSQGFISVESEPGCGATFTMHFPAVDAAPATGAPAAGIAPGPAGRETILLVEDEDGVRGIIGAVLRRQGYDVLEAGTPGAARSLFEERHKDIDLLLTDVIMPEMNGPSLAQRLIAEKPDLRVLFISGYADLRSPIDASNPNVGFLMKPFQGSALLAKVREVLARPRVS